MFERILERIEIKMKGTFLKPNKIVKDGLKLMVNHNDTTLVSWYSESEVVQKEQLAKIEEKFGLKVE